MEEYLNQYGFLALVAGTFFEGETAILIASSLIHQGFFEIPHVIVFGFAGSFISDWLYYIIGRLNGKYFVERRPKLQQRFSVIETFFKQNQFVILFTYRFLYGFRVILPLMIGMSRIKPLTFLFCSVISGLLWASVLCALGFVIGQVMEVDTAFIQRNIVFILLGFAAFGVLLGYAVKRITSSKVKQNIIT